MPVYVPRCENGNMIYGKYSVLLVTLSMQMTRTTLLRIADAACIVQIQLRTICILCMKIRWRITSDAHVNAR